MNIFNIFQKKKLSVEAFYAYYNRLPDEIEVRWFRDGKMIVGEVSDGKKRFMTQGRDANDFVSMVNDALITAYNISSEYCDGIKRSRAFLPSLEEYKKLENLNIKKSKFGIVKIAEKELVTV